MDLNEFVPEKLRDVNIKMAREQNAAFWKLVVPFIEYNFVADEASWKALAEIMDYLYEDGEEVDKAEYFDAVVLSASTVMPMKFDVLRHPKTGAPI